MKNLSLFNFKKKKVLINLFFFLLFTFLFIISSPNFNSYYLADIKYTTYIYIAGVALFYIYNIVLLPIKMEERNNKRYLWFTLCCILIYTAIELLFLKDLIIANNITNNIFGLDFHNLFQLEQLIKISATICIPLIGIGVLSFIYSLLVYGGKKNIPYLEIGINLLILTIIYVFAVFTPQIRIKEIIVTSITLIVFYTNTFLITPVLITERNKPKYGFLLIILFICYYLFMIKAFGIPKFDPETGSLATYRNTLHLVYLISGILFTTLFLSFVYGYSRIKIKAKEKSFDLKLGAKESELSLLKSQVNPHFLFNSLNTLYATALTENAPKTAESIAKLASLIRYMQEDINKDFIPLLNEIKYLQDYIAIQKLRCAVEPEVEIHFENFENHSISPGLLIPFVENSFKYGIDPSKLSKLKISVVCDDNKITFECINSYDENYKTYYKEQGFGIGIENAKQRLELVYPKKHTFEIVKEKGNFSIKIVINTSI